VGVKAITRTASALKNDQNLLLPSIVAQAQKTMARAAQVKKDGSTCKIDQGARKVDSGACEIDSALHRKCRLAHRSSRPNFFPTETFHRNAEDEPNTHGVVVRNACFCVGQQHAQCCAGAENTPHRQRQLP